MTNLKLKSVLVITHSLWMIHVSTTWFWAVTHTHTSVQSLCWCVEQMCVTVSLEVVIYRDGQTSAIHHVPLLAFTCAQSHTHTHSHTHTLTHTHILTHSHTTLSSCFVHFVASFIPFLVSFPSCLWRLERCKQKLIKTRSNKLCF